MPEQLRDNAGAELARAGQSGSETLKVWISWCWVGIPGLWGVYHVVVDALKLFR